MRQHADLHEIYAETLKAQRRHRGHLTRTPAHVMRYQDALLTGVPIAGAKVLDIGGGGGDLSMRVVIEGATLAVCLEPISAGSRSSMRDQFTQWQEEIAVGHRIALVEERLADYTPSHKFDIAIMNNVINHLDEPACSRLGRDSSAWDSYLNAAHKLATIVRPGGYLIVADCSSRNLFGDLGLRNPMAPTIQWDIHQPPATWRRLFQGHGFLCATVRWDAPPQLGKRAARALSHSFGAYVTNSHYILQFRRAQPVDERA